MTGTDLPLHHSVAFMLSLKSGGGGMASHVCDLDFDFDPMTFIHELDRISRTF